MEATAAGVKVVGPEDGKEGFLGSIGVRFMIDGEEAGERFSLVEHPMSARALAAPLHRHNREDEYSYVLEGRVGALLGDEVLIGEPGDLIFKPRNQWHTFWNAGDEPARLLEIISPAGFERYFEELVDMGGVVIDLRPMHRIRVGTKRRTATAQAGALLGELDAATQEFGLVVPAGIVTHTGLAGLTLGGGIGWVMRKHGLTIDQLISAQVVIANGEVVRASSDENADLFWGIRG